MKDKPDSLSGYRLRRAIATTLLAIVGTISCTKPSWLGFHHAGNHWLCEFYWFLAVANWPVVLQDRRVARRTQITH